MSGSHAIEVCETGVGFRFLFHSVLYNLNSEVQKVRNWIGSTRESELPYNKNGEVRLSTFLSGVD